MLECPEVRERTRGSSRPRLESVARIESVAKTPTATGRSWQRGWWASLVALSLASGCALIDSGPELPLYPGANRRPINPYGELPEAPTPPLESGEAALSLALRNEELLRHVQGIDAKYSGRRRQSLAWTGQARFESVLPPEPESASESEGAAEPMVDDGSLREAEAAYAAELGASIARAIDSDGGYWQVTIASNVRETRIFYTCELPISRQGEPLVPFDARDACGWKGSQQP